MSSNKQYFPWKDEYSVGVERIDLQHKELVALLNEIYVSLSGGDGRRALGSILDRLVAYVQFHFREEEMLMERAGYVGFAEHADTHAKIAAHVAALVSRYKKGALTNPIEISNFLKGWLTKHILETDMKYAPALRAHLGRGGRRAA